MAHCRSSNRDDLAVSRRRPAPRVQRFGTPARDCNAPCLPARHPQTRTIHETLHAYNLDDRAGPATVRARAASQSPGESVAYRLESSNTAAKPDDLTNYGFLAACQWLQHRSMT